MQHADNLIYTLVLLLYMLRCEIKVTYLEKLQETYFIFQMAAGKQQRRSGTVNCDTCIYR